MAKRTVPSHVDSTGKLLERIALLSKEPVLQGGRPIIDPVPERVLVTPSLLREMRCTAGCTACCLPFTLDFTPEEWAALEWDDGIRTVAEERFYIRTIEVNGDTYEIFSYDQYKDPSCPFLRPTREGGALGCGFWPGQPLECAAAPNLLMTTRGPGVTCLMKRPFGRGWAWKEKPQCEFDPVVDRIERIPDTFDLSNEISLLTRYLRWAEYLGISTVIPEVIEILKDFPQRLRSAGLRSVEVRI